MPKFSEEEQDLNDADEFHDRRQEVVESGQGKKKFAKAMSQIDDQEARHERSKDLTRMAPNEVDATTGIGYSQGRITEPRCHVCQHPHRDWIETMLIRGASYKGLQDRIPAPAGAGYDKLDRRSISNHHKNHMDLQDAALRAILEKEAQIQGQNFEEGVEDAITKRGVLEIALRKGYEDIVTGVTTVEPRDLIQIAKVLGDMDSHQHQIGLDEARAQVQIFIPGHQGRVRPRDAVSDWRTSEGSPYSREHS
jgi:hypothetical protein